LPLRVPDRCQCFVTATDQAVAPIFINNDMIMTPRTAQSCTRWEFPEGRPQYLLEAAFRGP
jgi:hypothetical protein